MDVDSIRNIEFGLSDGTEEAREFHDKIGDMFFDNDNYISKLYTPRIHMIVGRKGTGKSILLNVFINKLKRGGNSAQIYTMKKLVARKLRLLGYTSIAEEEADLFWQYVLLELLVNQVINEGKLTVLERESLEASLNRLTTAISGGTENTSKKTTGGLSVKDMGISRNVEGSVQTTFIASRNYYDNYDKIYNSLKQQIKSSKMQFVVAIDDLDELSDGLSNEKFLYLSNKFIAAIHNLNADLRDDDIKAKFIVTLRSDLMDSLQKDANNLAKYVNDSAINVNWFMPNKQIKPYDIPLAKMILHKMEASLSHLKHQSYEIQYYKMFTGLDNKTENKNHINLLLRFSFGRPRDVIMFLKAYQAQYPNDNSFDLKKMEASTYDYAKSFYSELLNEMALSEYKQELHIVLGAIARIKKRNLWFSELVSKIHDEEEKINENVIRLVIQQLYKYGAIGIRTNKSIEFSYREGSPENFDFDKRMGIHYAIAKYFSL